MELFDQLKKRGMTVEDLLASNSRLLKTAAKEGNLETTKQLTRRISVFFGVDEESALELIRNTAARQLELQQRELK